LADILTPLGEIGGLTLVPGLYKWTTGVTVTTAPTFSGHASDSAFFTHYLIHQLTCDLYQAWILQIAGTLTMASAQTMLLAGGAIPKNIVWVVASDVTLGTTSHFEGVILGKTGITLQTGGSMNGRALAQTMVALQKATLVPPP
jgi:Ice-binding-like